MYTERLLLLADRFEDEVLMFATKLANGPTQAMANIKKFVNCCDGLYTDESLELEGPLYESKDAREGNKAFAEKGPAQID